VEPPFPLTKLPPKLAAFNHRHLSFSAHVTSPTKQDSHEMR